jgi:TldD protein
LRDQIEEALRGHNADYVEIRLEESTSSRLAYLGGKLEDIGRTFARGGNVRASFRGGWGYVTFNDLDGLRERVSLAVRQARLVGREQTALAPVEPVVAVVPPLINKDPTAVPFGAKRALLEEYNEILRGHPQVSTSSIRYGDSKRTIVFASSEGAYIEQTKIDVTANIRAIARADSDVQQAGISLGANGDYGIVEGRHEEVQQLGDRAAELLAAPRAQSGEYTVICDPVLAGVFAHEAFGHLSEADFIYENGRMREIMVLGRRFGRSILNISDGAAVPGLRGSYAYDDEGVPARKTDLIREGVLVGRLHSRETAGKLGEQPTGNARAISYRFPPIVRMTNTFIEPGTSTLEDMLADVKEGIYAKDWYGGMTSMEMFTFSAAEAFRIRDGRIAEPLRGVILTGNIFSTLENIDAVGNDMGGLDKGGGCGKGGQMPLPVANGGPHIRIQKCVIGG